jgi:hypothetical protein
MPDIGNLIPLELNKILPTENCLTFREKGVCECANKNEVYATDPKLKEEAFRDIKLVKVKKVTQQFRKNLADITSRLLDMTARYPNIPPEKMSGCSLNRLKDLGTSCKSDLYKNLPMNADHPLELLKSFKEEINNYTVNNDFSAQNKGLVNRARLINVNEDKNQLCSLSDVNASKVKSELDYKKFLALRIEYNLNKESSSYEEIKAQPLFLSFLRKLNTTPNISRLISSENLKNTLEMSSSQFELFYKNKMQNQIVEDFSRECKQAFTSFEKYICGDSEGNSVVEEENLNYKTYKKLLKGISKDKTAKNTIKRIHYAKYYCSINKPIQELMLNDLTSIIPEAFDDATEESLLKTTYNEGPMKARSMLCPILNRIDHDPNKKLSPTSAFKMAQELRSEGCNVDILEDKNSAKFDDTGKNGLNDQCLYIYSYIQNMGGSLEAILSYSAEEINFSKDISKFSKEELESLETLIVPGFKLNLAQNEAVAYFQGDIKDNTPAFKKANEVVEKRVVASNENNSSRVKNLKKTNQNISSKKKSKSKSKRGQQIESRDRYDQNTESNLYESSLHAQNNISNWSGSRPVESETKKSINRKISNRDAFKKILENASERKVQPKEYLPSRKSDELETKNANLKDQIDSVLSPEFAGMDADDIKDALEYSQSVDANLLPPPISTKKKNDSREIAGKKQLANEYSYREKNGNVKTLAGVEVKRVTPEVTDGDNEGIVGDIFDVALYGTAALDPEQLAQLDLSDIKNLSDTNKGIAEFIRVLNDKNEKAFYVSLEGKSNQRVLIKKINGKFVIKPKGDLNDPDFKKFYTNLNNAISKGLFQKIMKKKS